MTQPKDTITGLRVAIVHDWLYGGGAEKVILELHRMFPDASIYTSYCSDEWRAKLDGKVVTGYLQWWPFAKARKLLPLLRQWWFAGLRLKGYDLVISSSGNGEAKFVKPKAGTKHLCYCYTPTHFYWSKYDQYIAEPGMGVFNGLARLGLKLLVKPLRKRDYAAAQRVDQFIAISSHIQHDIKQFYGRDSVVVHPPVDTERFALTTHGVVKPVQYIAWGRHVPYKRFDLTIAACNELQLPLTVIGAGPETAKLKSMAGPTVTFTGFVEEIKLMELASQASAFIFPAEEDFGIAPVEAMAMGLPVIAYKAGGALDYVVSGKTGEFFAKQTVGSITQLLKSFKPRAYSTKDLQDQAGTFSRATFQANIRKQIERII